jgi:hypothetical protein
MNKFIKSYKEIINENSNKIFNFSFTGIKNIIRNILSDRFVDVKFFRGMSTFTFSKIVIKYGNQKYIKNYKLEFEYIPSKNLIRLILTELISPDNRTKEDYNTNNQNVIEIEIDETDNIESLTEKIKTEINSMK